MRRPPPAPDEICGRHNREIRVRMGKFTKALCSACDAPCGVLCTGCVGIKGVSLPPQVGFEPTTLRLTAECSTVELRTSGSVNSRGRELLRTVRAEAHCPFL